MLYKMSELFKRPEMFNWKMYKGVVVDNEDPTMIKRARVTIDGIYPEGNNDLLPWIAAFTDSPKSLNAPEVGDELCVIFPFDDIYHPFYLGYWNSGTTGNSYLQDDYPNTFGFIYNNLKARFNKDTKIGEMVHSSGSSIAIDADGNLVISGAKDVSHHSTGKFTVTSDDDMAFSSGGKFNLSSDGDAVLNFGAKLNLSSDADMVINSGGKLTMSATGDILISTSAQATFSGDGGTKIGSGASQTQVLGAQVALGGPGGTPVALVGNSLVQGVGNLGAPVISQILTGSSTVTATS